MKPILLNFPVPIITPRLILRPPQIGDGLVVNEAVLESFDVLNEFMPWTKKKPSFEESEEFVRRATANWILKINNEPYLPFFIFDKKTSQFIGSSGYHNYNWDIPSIETGYWIRSSCTGRGLMTEAVNALTQYAFKQLGVGRITITCDATNIRSRKIPERLGFSLEGTLKGNRRNPVTNKLSDTLVYSRYDLNNIPYLATTWEKESQ